MMITDANAPIDLRRSSADRYAILAMLIPMGLVALVLAVSGLLIARESVGFALFFLVMGGFIGAMTLLVLNEAVVRWRTRIRIDGGMMSLSLPGRRSYVPQAPVERELPLAAIRAVQTRGEAFRAAGNTVLQQVYALQLDDGSRLILGADRRMVAPFYAEAAQVIAAQVGVPIDDLGYVDGNPGFLMFWGQTAPDWDAEPLPPAAAETRVRQEQRAWQWVSIVVFILLLARIVAALLR